LTTDASGFYTTNGLPVGKYKIDLDAAGYAPQSLFVDVTTATIFTVNFANVPQADGSIEAPSRNWCSPPEVR